MSTRQVATTGITLALGFILGALAWQPSFAQRKAEEAPKSESAVGRYQMRATSASSSIVAVCDTATGHCWVHYAISEGGKWYDLGSPVQAKK